jgi:SAM-dependent methyltransferase
MNPREYAAMFAVEDRHWWYRGVRREIEQAVARFGPPEGRWLDAGCGTGGLLAGLSGIARGTGIDISPMGLRLARSRGLTRLAQASVSSLPFPDRAFGLITSVDVLAHRQVAMTDALRELARCLAPNGLLVLQLPAFEALRGAHDDAVWTQRRFRKEEVARLLRAAGLRLRLGVYRNSLLFPVAAVRRLLTRGSRHREARSDVGPVPAPLNSLLFGVLELDRLLRGIGLALPFGLSVLCVATRPEDAEPQVSDRIHRTKAGERGPG